MGSITRRDLLRGLGVVAFSPEIDGLVALIERTPRERCAEMVAERLRGGVSYRQLLAALFLAGIRNINPRPPGFALHCVFVIHSAHLLGLEAAADSRLLPLFYALDNFKAAQERDARQGGGDYTMQPLRGPLPSPGRAASEFTAAMEAWDAERAERAVVALARERGPAEVFATLWAYGARDYRNIGHKAIFVANAARTLQAIGWQHAEPVLRSLVLALLDFGKDQKVNGYAFTDQCYLGNLKRVRAVAEAGAGEGTATRRMLDAMRAATPEEACAELVKSKATAWDAVHLAAAELALRARGGAAIVGIHAVTSANALHHACLAASEPHTRALLLLQAVGWMAQFRTLAETRQRLPSGAITGFEPGPEPATPDEILAGVGSQPDEAAARAFRLCADPAARQAFLGAALRHVLHKADEVHYYKYLAALIEDIPLAGAQWQPHLAAAVASYAKGPNDPEPAAMQRARAALGLEK